jgi:uncharacterized protein (DUF1778 family)
MPNAKPEGKRKTLSVRIKPELRSLIGHAAELSGKNPTDFVLDAARHAAENALLGCTRIVVSPKSFARLRDRLDAPPRPGKRLRRTMQSAAPWE